MNLSEKYSHCLEIFKKQNPNPKTELNYSSNYELLVAVILSAQCTDKRVNQITPPLFQAFPHPESLANANFSEIFEYIKSCSYPNNKAIHLQGMAQTICKQFNGNIPDNLNDLLSIPGVGRKTANVILSILFNKAAMAVDTHVFRVSNRIGLTPNANTPRKVEEILMKYTPQKEVHNMHHWLILHGRYTCKARNPLCNSCLIQNICDYRRETTNKDLSSLNF